jgi:putative FmdB family regulatory protein
MALGWIWGSFRVSANIQTMPIFEFICKKCEAITEVLIQGIGSESQAITCAQCGSGATTKLISRVTFKVVKPAKYSEEFLHGARPFLKAQKQTAKFFAEGKGSDDSKTFKLAEQIGERIDRTLAARMPVPKR